MMDIRNLFKLTWSNDNTIEEIKEKRKDLHTLGTATAVVGLLMLLSGFYLPSVLLCFLGTNLIVVFIGFIIKRDLYSMMIYLKKIMEE